MFSRRQLLSSLAFGGAACFAGLPGLVRAAEATDRYFIFCYFNGGWDLLLSLDPRDPDVFRSDLKKTTRIEPGYELLSSSYQENVETSVEGMTFGPAIGGLADHAERLCVVRGMSMDTLTHEVGRRRFITGQPPAGLQAKGSSIATVLASRLGSGEAIPQLSVRVESYNDGFPGFSTAIRVNSVEDLLRALRPSPLALTSTEQAALDVLLASAEDCPDISKSELRSSALGYREASKDLVKLGLGDLFDFTSPEAADLRDLYGISTYELDAAPAQAATAVTAITSGISRCVSIEAASGLDSHGPEWTSHPGSLKKGFDVVAAMLTDLASRDYGGGESWLDRTTVVCFSEFGRTPLLNSSGGRDHYLHNACVLAGGGVAGGRVIGASSDTGMAPLETDLDSGERSDAGEIVRPEHLFRGLLHGVGVEEDIADLDAKPLLALF